MTITVNPLPATFTITAAETSGTTNNDGTICIGASATLTASGTIAPIWSTGVTAQSITVSPTTTTTYTATITNAAGCQRTASRLITVRPLPVFSITNTNPVICSGASSLLSVSPSTGLSNFIWSPGTSTTSSMSVSPTTTTTYTVTARNTSTGCTNTATTTVTVNSVSNTACCSAAGYTFNTPINTSAMGTIPTGATIQVNANITVNSTRVFTNCTLRMAPNVKIIVNSNIGLELNNCTLFSCSEMWDGIEVLQNGTLTLSGTRIEDAKTGVLSTNGNLIVNNCTFNKNYIGITLREYPSYNGINGSTFTCESNLSPTPGSLLKAPYSNQKGYCGIFIDGNDAVTIGNTSTNFFRNIINGIFANRNTTLKFYRGNFSNIKGGLPTYNGYGIKVYGAESVLIGDLSNTALSNTFSNSDNGVTIDGVSFITVANNNFNGISTGSLVLNLTGKAIGIFNTSNNPNGGSTNLRNNIFEGFELGIYYEKRNSTLGLSITNNTFANFSTPVGTAVLITDVPNQNISITNNVLNNILQTGTNGIIINNPILFASSNALNIRQNTIRNVRNGIWVTGFSNVKIEDHHPSFNSMGTNQAGIYFLSSMTGSTGAPLTGIQIANCPNAVIDKNQIERFNPFQPSNVPLVLAANYDTHFGITVQNSCTGSIISNNQTKLLGTGIYAFGNTPITLKCNNMVNNATGLWVNSLIGQQGTFSAPQDNTWTIPAGYMGVRRNGQTQPQFFTRSFSLPYMPNTNSQMNPGFSIQPQSSSIFAPNTCFVSTPPPAGLVQVINEQGEYNYLSVEELKTLNLDLYKTLKITPDLYDESSLEGQRIEEFMDSVDISNSAKIYQYEEKLTSNDTLEAKELMALFEAYSDVEQTYKKVYEIYNRSWLDGVHSFTAEDSLLLNEIAYLSPRIAGNAVYTARVLLGLLIIDTETFGAKSAKQNSKVVYSKVKYSQIQVVNIFITSYHY